MIGFVALIVFLISSALHIAPVRILQPQTVFYWGDQIARIDRTESIRSSIFWGLIVAFLVSTVAGLLLAVAL